MKSFIETILKVFESDDSLESARRELAQARRDAPRMYGRSWSDRAHL